MKHSRKHALGLALMLCAGLALAACDDPSDSPERYADPTLQSCITVARAQHYDNPAHYCADLQALEKIKQQKESQKNQDAILRGTVR